VPTLAHPVTDLANVLSPEAEERIARELVQHREATGVQLAVLLVDTTKPIDIADFAHAVFDRWGGGSKQRNDGALFVLAIKDRRSRLHLGYGLEPLIPDAVAKRMLDSLRPWLVNKDYERATLEIVHAVQRKTDHLTPGAALAPPFGARRWVWPSVLVLGVGLGIAWALVFRRAWAAYKRSSKPPTKRKSKRQISLRKRFGVACVQLIRQRNVQLALGSVVLVQLLLVWVLGLGKGFIASYSLVYWSFLVVGWMIAGTPKIVSIPTGVFTTLAIICAFGLVNSETDSSGYVDPALLWLHVGAFTGGFWLVLVVFIPAIAGGASGSGGSSDSSYSSYSSSSSSSSSSGSSSYSSSSYSGGGGSSGGGGASSGW
jgi:uncharacterized protein